MKIYINHKYDTEILELARVLFSEEIVVTSNVEIKDECELWYLIEDDAFLLYENQQIIGASKLQNYSFPEFLDQKSQFKFALKKAFCQGVEKINGRKPYWGILTGVRPVKMVHKMFDLSYKKEDIIAVLTQVFLLKENNAILIVDIAERERRYFPESNESYSLYISIPFCPSKCTYCSFPTHVYKKWAHKEDEYMDKLIQEISAIAEVLKDKLLDTIYVGGGTPTSITAKNMDKLLAHLQAVFNESNIREFTYEAGRPDTIDLEKLQILKKYGVTRISINPQTMDDNILKNMGRSHSVADIKSCYKDSRAMGFDSINMDLIVGLPGDTVDGFHETLNQIEQLNPENITVHTLAIKRASALKDIKDQFSYPSEAEMQRMVDYSKTFLASKGYHPYYIYKQQNMLGNFENIGYAKDGKEGIYNILMMEEVQNIIAVGVGGVSKIHEFGTGRFDNIPNVRDIVEYLERYEEMIVRKLDHLADR